MAPVTGALAVAGLVLGDEAFTWLVLVATTIAVVDLSVVMGRTGTRPILPAALVAALGAPLTVVAGEGDQTVAAADGIADVVAIAVLLAFTLVLASGRRRSLVPALGVTLTVGLLTGAGSAAVLLLHGLSEGTRWVTTLLLTIAVVSATGLVVRVLQQRAAARAPSAVGSSGATPEPVPGWGRRGPLPALGAGLVVAGLLAAVMRPELPPEAVIAVVAVGVLAVPAADRLRAALRFEQRAPRPASAVGSAWRTVDAVLLAAPAAYVAVRVLT